MKKEVIICLAIVILICAHSASAIFMGTCEGYVKNATGGLVPGATVNVTVVGCSSEACSGTALTDSGGYYVIANLNLPAFGRVNVAANKSNMYGTNNGSADAFQAAYVNITLCSAPFPPTLTPQPDIHTTSANLSWISGIDPNGLPTYDRYQLDSNDIIENATSPQYESGLSYASHTWRVQTCNAACCSPWASDTFLVYNNPPTQPLLTDQPDTLNNSVTLYWTSGTDPDGDATYDEYQFQSNPIVSNATSPQNESGLTYQSYTWKVRTCDVLGACSNWAIDTFSVINNPCPAPTLTPEPDGHVTSVTLEWTSATVDIDGDPCHDRYQFDAEPIIDPATSPQTETGLSYGVSYTWKVQSCDNKGACSAWQYDTFLTLNNPPSEPTLVDQNHTSADAVALQWASGTDPDGDATYDEYQFDNGSVVNATSPQVESLSGIAVHTWQVRTCDIYGACSDWVSDDFIRYECAECPPCVCPPTAGRGGGGGARIPYLPENMTCISCVENWICEDWGECIGGIQTRECADLNNCKSTCYKPETWQRCVEVKRPSVEVPMPLYLEIPLWLMISVGLVAFGGVVVIYCAVVLLKKVKVTSLRKKRR